MSTSATPTDDNDDVVSAFKDAFDGVHTIKDRLYQDQFDGPGWVYNDRIVLVTEDMTQCGDIDMTTLTDGEYVETTTLEFGDSSDESPQNQSENKTGKFDDVDTVRCYGFQAGDTVDYINVNYLRTLANEVFDASYNDLKSWALTTSDDSSRHEQDGPVVFDHPNSEYLVVVLPVITG